MATKQLSFADIRGVFLLPANVHLLAPSARGWAGVIVDGTLAQSRVMQRSPWALNQNALHLVECDVVGSPVVELRGPGGSMIGHRRRPFEHTTIL